MLKFSIVISLVFVLGVWAEWVMLSNPSSGVVLGMKYQPLTDTYKVNVMTSEGTLMEISMSSKVWREHFEARTYKE